MSFFPGEPGKRREASKLLAEARGSLDGIRDHVQGVAEAREGAIEAIRAAGAAVEQERERVTQLVAQVDAMVHNVTSVQLAKEYAEQATKEEASAGRYTRAALGIAGATAVVGVIFALVALAGHHDLTTVLGKASLAIPLLAFAAYVGKLGGDHRRMAWHWRHVELQIRTADPFIAPLDDSARKVILAALALRLFPGQSQDPQRGGVEHGDPSGFLSELARIPTSHTPQS